MCERQYYKATLVTQSVILESVTAGAPGKPEYGGRPVIVLRYRFQTGGQGETWTVYKKSLRDKLAKISKERVAQREHNEKCSFCAEAIPVTPLAVKLVTDPYSDELVDVQVVQPVKNVEEITF